MEGETTNRDEVVAIELPAPQGWKKRFTPKKGGTPRRNEIVFISPTGEEIKSKRQLEQYIKSHPGGPPASEFDWGTGDTPRRSARLVKSKEVESPESEKPKKKQKKSSSKKEAKGKTDDVDGEGQATEDKEAADAEEETKENAAEEVVGDHDGDKDMVEDTKEKTNEGEEVINEEVADEKNVEKPENEETGNKISDAMEEDTANKSLATPELEENKKDEAEEISAEHEAPSQFPVPTEAASSEIEAKIVKDADAKAEKESEEAKVGEEDHHNKEETPAEEVGNAEEVKPDNDSLKEQQDGGKPTENHSVSCEGAPHEPKPSQISC